jgi:hypothetical protein
VTEVAVETSIFGVPRPDSIQPVELWHGMVWETGEETLEHIDLLRFFVAEVFNFKEGGAK